MNRDGIFIDKDKIDNLSFQHIKGEGSDTYISNLTGCLYHLSLLQTDETHLYEYEIEDPLLESNYTYWMAITKIYYCIYDIDKSREYSFDKLVDLAALQYIVFNTLNQSFNDKDLNEYLSRYKGFVSIENKN